MIPFLEELAQKIIQQYSRPEELTIVFPNQRAALFFRNYLSGQLSKPAWSPTLITIEALFHELSDLREADKLGLIFRLFRAYGKVMNREESFDRFYFWGDMMLRDFDEVDKYLVPATLLFKDLSKWRELDESFDYLTGEQKKFLQDFWSNFEDKPAGSKEEFLRVWRELPNIYNSFVKSLKDEGLGYEGMIHRRVAERIGAGKLVPKRKQTSAREGRDQAEKPNPGSIGAGQQAGVIFAGFNALTKSEEILISHFVSEGAQVFWDVDAYYLDNSNQEAGQFFRQYRRHPVLGATFESSLPSNFRHAEKAVDLYGVPQKVGQAKLLGQLLANEPNQSAVKTVVVLPDESMLLAVMHSLPDTVESVNVTMGYPLRNTPLYNLLELMLDLQINRKGDTFSHRQVTAILAHAYIMSQEEKQAHALRFEIIRQNRVYVAAAELQKGDLLNAIFQVVSAEDIAAYLLGIVHSLGTRLDDRQSFDREYAFHFHRQLSRLHEVLRDSGSRLDVKGFQRLFRQIIQSQKIPFTGEPLKGLQIMGVLETRNLDFDNVYILSLNEGSLPAAPRQGSYIPHTIRRAYSLPTHEHQDAIYAYLFYRVLQRAKNIRLFYNTEPDVLGMGEMSRFVQQLVHESGWKINPHILNNPIQVTEVKAIEIAKTPDVLKALAKYTDPEGKGISPSKLNDYIECSLRFYLKYVAGLEEAKEVEEDMDARIFGNFLHNVIDWFYREKIEHGNFITSEDLDPGKAELLLDHLIDRAFHKLYPDQKIENRGQSVVVRAIVKQFARRIIEMDREYAPFTIELIEEKNFSAPFPISVNGLNSNIIISGRIDRVDSKDGLVRVIDYKTGKDELSFDSIPSLFAREGKRNKAAFQTILYAWLYRQNRPDISSIQPVLMNRKNLYDDGSKTFRVDKKEIVDIKPFLPDFEGLLKALLEELYNPTVLFTQTPEQKNCKFCLFKDMCRRN